MTNTEISKFLRKMAVLMNIRGINPFKIRAYDRVVESIKEFPGSIQELAENNQLQSVEGIGKGISEVITDLVKTGKSSAMEELLGDMPETIFEIVEIPGLGPKKTAFLYDQLGIGSLEDLERAAHAGYLSGLKGFGKKSVDKILKGIALRKQALTHRSIGFALPLAREIIERIRENDRIAAISEAGCIRRRTETAEELEIVCASPDPDYVIEKFISMPIVDGINNETGNSATIVVENNFPVTLYVVESDKFPAFLFLKTGSEVHLAKVKELLSEKGLWIEEDGTVLDDSENRVPISSEEELYEKAGLPFIPPEIRENGEEIRAALSGNLPELVTLDDIRGDLQMHSTYSDGSTDIRGMAEKAMSLGYAYIAMTDHSQSLHIAHGLEWERIEIQHREIDDLNREYEGRFRIFKSAEVDVLSDGRLDYDDEILKTLDFVLVSIHMGMNMPGEKMTHRVIEAITHPGVHCLAHPSGRLIGRRREFEMDWDSIFEAAKDAGIAIEINAHPARLDLNDIRCKRAKEMGIPILINTDAHSPDGMELMEYGINVARRGWLTKADILNTRSVDETEQWLSERKK